MDEGEIVIVLRRIDLDAVRKVAEHPSEDLDWIVDVELRLAHQLLDLGVVGFQPWRVIAVRSNRTCRESERCDCNQGESIDHHCDSPVRFKLASTSAVVLITPSV